MVWVPELSVCFQAQTCQSIIEIAAGSYGSFFACSMAGEIWPNEVTAEAA